MIKRKKKPCKGCQKQVYIFSHGYGKCCYHIYKANKRKEKIENGEVPPGGEINIFMEIWKERPHKSELSGKPLHILKVSHFAHILSKAQNKYPKYKYFKKNIWLLTEEEHYLLDHGTEKQRQQYAEENNISWEPLYAYRETLRELYPHLEL